MRFIKKSKNQQYAFVEIDGEIKKRYIYKCYICGKEIIEYRPVRFIKQLYGYGQYKQYYNIRTYDFCKECYEVLDDLLFKWHKTKNK